MVRNPIPLIVHLTCWSLLAALGVVLDDPFIEMTWPRVVVILKSPLSIGKLATAASIVFDEIVDDVTRNGFWIVVVGLPFLIGYREARGNLKGIAREQQVWMGWYRRQQEAIAAGSTFAELPPPSENMRTNSYFRKAQKTLLFMVRDPKPLLIHFLCWFFAYFFLILMTELPDIADIIRTARSFARNFSRAVLYLATFAAIFAIISSYQETRGSVKGIAKVGQTWTKWYHQQQEAKAQGIPFDVPPPLFDTAG